MSENDTVCLSYIHDVDVAYSWHQSLLSMIMYDAEHRGRLLRGGYVGVRCAKSADLYDARNLAVKGFLESDADWMFFIDTDMGFTPDTVDRLLATADAKKRPIVGGLCFAQRELSEDGMFGYRAVPRFTIMDWVDVDGKQKFAGRSTYPVNAVVQCAGTGAACILMHRSVFEAIKEEYGEVWYDRIKGEDGSLLGEDMSFCVRAGALNFPVFVDTAVKTTHFKHLWLGEADFWRQVNAPPAVEPCAVLVPVMKRPQNAEPFMRSLRASTGLASVYAIANEEDVETIAAWEQAGATVLSTTLTSFAEKVNYGYQNSDEPWLFLVGDDVRFTSSWLDQAQVMAGDRYDVIGTNDLANPDVVDGKHATHMLIRRSYVDGKGASWDGPKVVAHEGYHHWFVDNEIVTVAQERDTWAMALASVVEHMHPMCGKGEMDEVYERGASRQVEDRKLFKARYRKFSK